jgi:AcrR family transcriptional regulator
MTDDPAAAEATRREKRRRSDAQHNRVLVVRAAAQLLRRHQPLTMRAVAHAAGISRSTLYRHFATPAELHRAVQQETLTAARRAIERSLSQRKPPLGQLRSAVLALVQVGARHPLAAIGQPPEESFAEAGNALHPLAQRLADAAGLAPALTGLWLRAAIAHFVATCLRSGWEHPGDVHDIVEELLHVITDPLDRGLLLLDSEGAVVALNPDARIALGGVATEAGRPVVIRAGGLYEDGSSASPQTHPVTVALTSRERREGIRGHRSRDDSLRWFSIDVRPLSRPCGEELYGFVAVFTDVSAEKRRELAHLRPPGELGASAAPLLDIVRVLDEVPAPLLPEQLVAEAMRLTGGPAALYVLDIDGSHLLRLAGREDFPARLKAPLALGPELAEDGLPDLAAHMANELPGAVMAPMWLRGRAVGILLALRGAESGLREVARLGAAAMELANGYTDVIDAARRRKDMNPAAEIQQSLVPPRIARMGSGELAGSVLPSYDVGGDWFDYVDNRDGAWIAIADASGKGPQAAGLGSVALAALRAARRNDANLEEATQVMHETVSDVGGPEFFVTAIIARWHPVHSVLSWINCGHPPPLLLHTDDSIDELATKPDLPLGLLERTRQFRRHQRRLLDGDRVVFYSDGISRRRTGDGLFGTEGIAKAAKTADGHSATATARAIQEAVVSASEDPLPDDAAVIVLAANAAAGSSAGSDGRRGPG